LPFMATEQILMAGVQIGADRQDLHERLRRHSLAAAENVKLHGRENDLIERLKSDPAFSRVNLSMALEPANFTGRSAAQVAAFVERIVRPVREKYRPHLAGQADLRV